MQTFSFNHLALAVKDVASSIAFYQAVFGLGEIENTASNSKTSSMPFYLIMTVIMMYYL